MERSWDLTDWSPISFDSIERGRNVDVERGLVTLGRRTFTSMNLVGTGSKFPRVTMRGDGSFGVYSMISGNSTGKTVLSKRILAGWHLCEPDRPIIVFDMQGKDHRLNKYPSSHGFIFSTPPVNERRFGFGDKQINLTPLFLKKDSFGIAFPDEVYFALSWLELNDADWEYLLTKLSGSGSNAWIQSFLLILQYAKAENMKLNKFIDILTIAASLSNAQRLKKTGYIKKIIPSEVSPAELKSISKTLKILIGKNFIVDESSKFAAIDPIDLLIQGNIVNLSFHNVSSVEVHTYVGVLLRRMYDYYDELADICRARSVDFISPLILFEEFNKLVPLNSDDDKSESPALKNVKGMINQGQKNRLKFLLNFQDAAGVDTELRRGIISDAIFACNVNYSDMRLIVEKHGTKAKDVLQALDLKKDEYRAKEWALFLESEIITFRPAASPLLFDERERSVANRSKNFIRI